MEKIKVTSEKLYDLNAELTGSFEKLNDAFDQMADMIAATEEYLQCSAVTDILLQNLTAREKGKEALNALLQKIKNLMDVASIYEGKERENTDIAERIN